MRGLAVVMIDIKVPAVGESIGEVTLLKWMKKDGDFVERDEVIAELESEKATFEVNAEQAGVIRLGDIKEGDSLKIGELLASIDESKGSSGDGSSESGDRSSEAGMSAETSAKETASAEAASKGIASAEATAKGTASAEALAKAEKKPLKTSSNGKEKKSKETAVKETSPEEKQPASELKASPVASAIIADKKVDPATLTPTGFQGKILKEDVLAAITEPGRKSFDGAGLFSRNTREEKMTNLRKTISRRLVEAKNTTAMLTTFNEVDMSRIMEIRNRYKDKFKEIHGVNLGFMSFFAKACSLALSEWPSVNAFIDGDNIIYHNYADISIAVSTPRGLTVPVIRNVESLGMAAIEKKVIDLATRARDSKLTTEDLTGGTFTITNGGVFGSLMSTPIINIPQSAILGMHKIEERPVALNGQVVIKPMMYLALSYDHRIIDGRESVSFLVRIKELLEHPEQLLIGADPVKTLLEL
jgi:2-oxoglutarate dehydrogenase E2 component (dihydrolipoamide succinyltransferase)